MQQQNPCTVKECRCASFEEAALRGHLQCFVYLSEDVPHYKDWNEAANWAALYGRLECLQHAHETGCPPHKSVCVDAAMGGHIACLKYAHNNGYPWDEEKVSTVTSWWGDVWCKRYNPKNVSWSGRQECLSYANDLISSSSLGHSGGTQHPGR